MREILFRGKRKYDGKWFEGYYYLSKNGKESFILFPCTTFPWWDKAVVDPSTVGQFTGVTDKNGKKIFEGDICTISFLTISGIVDRSENYKCEFYEGKFCFVSDNGKFRCWYSEKEYIYEGACHNNIEVVGNIHDNPELLKGDEV